MEGLGNIIYIASDLSTVISEDPFFGTKWTVKAEDVRTELGAETKAKNDNVQNRKKINMVVRSFGRNKTFKERSWAIL